MDSVEAAASHAIAIAKKRERDEVGPDEILLGCLQSIAAFGIAQVGAWSFDLEELGVEWVASVDRAGAKVAYSERAVTLFDLAARIARAHGAAAMGVDHLLAAFAGESDGLMGEWKRERGITNAGWRAGVARMQNAARGREDSAREECERPAGIAARDYLTPEEAAEALSIHVQTLRAYVRSGKLPALRLAGERAIRIRRKDLEAVLEPLVPQG
jgi:excisionase family DNA binding protein